MYIIIIIYNSVNSKYRNICTYTIIKNYFTSRISFTYASNILNSVSVLYESTLKHLMAKLLGKTD